MKSGQAQALGVKYIEVNLSVLQCVQEQLSDRLMEIMAEYGIPPEEINFEITETAGLANYDALLKNMNCLISKGVTFSMDDYGTGFSTANYLITLPMDIVKIDKSIDQGILAECPVAQGAVRQGLREYHRKHPRQNIRRGS